MSFYEKISPKINGKILLIPTPTLSPQERERRRLAYRNDQILYKKNSSLSGKSIVSMFHKDAPYQIYSHDEWWSDKWDGLQFGVDFDFNKPFFEQFYELQLRVPRPPLVNNKAENSDYCNFADGNRNCYLVNNSNRNEDCFYSFLLVDNKDVSDSIWCLNSELLYECIDVRSCYNLKFSQYCENCRDSAFLYNCKGVSNSFFCINLTEKSYYIFNKPCSKEDYAKAVNYISGSYSRYQECLEKFEKLKRDFPIRRANTFVSCENVSGDNIFNSKNIYKSFYIFDSQDISYSHDGVNSRDCADISFFDGAEMCYESTSLMGYGYRFTIYCRDSYNLFYCDNCHSCKNCFGCIGLRNKQYCVFNKQYSEKEYEELIEKIINYMSGTKEWGEFFPIKYSLFAYNETLAFDYFPVTKEEALKNGWKWRESDEQNVLEGSNYSIPDNINDVSDDICDKVLKCEKTGKPYKIIIPELKFYRKIKLPIPRICPQERHLNRVKLMTPQKLWGRKCEKCGIDLETPYGPDRFEKIYCEECYLKEIY